MKKYLLLLVAPLLILASCQGPIETIHFESPDGDNTITVTGERQGSVGPIIARVNLKTAGMEDSFSFEHQASSLTAENCTAKWENNNHAILTFTLDDGAVWECECFLLEDKLRAIKMFKNGGTLFD